MLGFQPVTNGVEVAPLLEPIRDHVARTLGQGVEIEAGFDAVRFRRSIDADRYDLVFAEVHVAATLIERKRHVIVAVVPGRHRSVVYAGAGPTRPMEIGDLSGRAVCTAAPPDLATRLFLDRFTNPLRQPSLRLGRSPADPERELASGRCLAALTTLTRYRRFPAPAPRVFAMTAPYPGPLITVADRLGKALRPALDAALRSREGTRASRNLLQALGASSWGPSGGLDTHRWSRLLDDD